jgi:hypothetical protein
MTSKRGIENFKDGWRAGYYAASSGTGTKEPSAGYPEWRSGYSKGFVAGKKECESFLKDVEEFTKIKRRKP